MARLDNHWHVDFEGGLRRSIEWCRPVTEVSSEILPVQDATKSIASQRWPPSAKANLYCEYLEEPEMTDFLTNLPPGVTVALEEQKNNPWILRRD